jgi:zeta-carotene desaturase
VSGRPHLVVVGGGFAGLAAGVRLARAGASVTLLEARPFLGGRAYSFTDPVTGDVVDNGPHALAGAYTEALDFLGEIGAAGKLAMQPRLSVAMADPLDGVGAIAAPRLPGPLQAPAALLGYRLLARRERLGVLAGAVRLVARARRRPGAIARATVAEALAGAGQSARACSRFWYPLATATLNEVPEAAAAEPHHADLALLHI